MFILGVGFQKPADTPWKKNKYFTATISNDNTVLVHSGFQRYRWETLSAYKHIVRFSYFLFKSKNFILCRCTRKRRFFGLFRVRKNLKIDRNHKKKHVIPQNAFVYFGSRIPHHLYIHTSMDFQRDLVKWMGGRMENINASLNSNYGYEFRKKRVLLEKKIILIRRNYWSVRNYISRTRSITDDIILLSLL